MELKLKTPPDDDRHTQHLTIAPFPNDDMNLLAVIAFIILMFAAVGMLIGKPLACALSALLGLAFFLIMALADLVLRQ
jgi:uncharacterized membrane protein